MTVDLDALITEARAWADSRAGWNQYQVTLGVRLADALESTLAELRQERERAETLSHAVTDLIRMGNERANERDDVSAALSRAEETIEKVRDIVTHDGAGQDWRIRRALTEYGKQKEQA